MPTSESNKRVLRLDPRDNALVALTDLRQGEHVNFAGEDYLLLSDVPAKHKFLTQDLPADGNVTMYGVLVGKTSQPLRRGDLLSTRNLRHAAAAFHDKDAAPRWSPPDVSRWRDKTFLGYRRADGQVGTRNYWIVLPLVFCEKKSWDSPLHKCIGVRSRNWCACIAKEIRKRSASFRSRRINLRQRRPRCFTTSMESNS
jgi:hypothetical protein